MSETAREVKAPERPPKVTEHTGACSSKVHVRPSVLRSHPGLTAPSGLRGERE